MTVSQATGNFFISNLQPKTFKFFPLVPLHYFSSAAFGRILTYQHKPPLELKYWNYLWLLMHTLLITFWLAEKAGFFSPRLALFSMGPVIMPEPLLWLAKYFLQFKGTRYNHMRVNFIHDPGKIFSFDMWHLTCSHRIRKHIYHNGTNFL